jgi:hypothetical protein
MALPVVMGTRIRDTLRKATHHRLGRTRLPLGHILLHQGLTPLHRGHTRHSMGTLNRVVTRHSMVAIPLLVIPAHLTRVMAAAMVAWGWGRF